MYLTLFFTQGFWPGNCTKYGSHFVENPKVLQIGASGSSLQLPLTWRIQPTHSILEQILRRGLIKHAWQSETILKRATDLTGTCFSGARPECGESAGKQTRVSSFKTKNTTSVVHFYRIRFLDLSSLKRINLQRSSPPNELKLPAAGVDLQSTPFQSHVCQNISN